MPSALLKNKTKRSGAQTTCTAAVGPVGSVWDLPTSSLFKVSPGGGFLVETDPRFTNQRTWLNSDYLLSQLSLDAAGMQQRIGDGFYEQWLIREQVAQLTGRRYLENYADDEAQYRALMEAGVTLAQDWNLEKRGQNYFPARSLKIKAKADGETGAVSQTAHANIGPLGNIRTCPPAACSRSAPAAASWWKPIPVSPTSAPG